MPFAFSIISDQYVEEARNYRCPPMSRSQHKTEMLKEMQSKLQTGYVKGKMQDTSTQKKEESNCSPPGLEEVRDGEAPSATPAEDASVPSLDVKSVTEGTPIVTMFSPYRDLPGQSKWAKDVTASSARRALNSKLLICSSSAGPPPVRKSAQFHWQVGPGAGSHQEGA
jgi:hypothetical protein